MVEATGLKIMASRYLQWHDPTEFHKNLSDGSKVDGVGSTHTGR
jgi:hypothetical protein